MKAIIKFVHFDITIESQSEVGSSWTRLSLVLDLEISDGFLSSPFVYSTVITI